MKYLCLIYLSEHEMDAMPAGDMKALNAKHLDFNDGLRTKGTFIEAEALQPAGTTACVRVRQGKVSITDGPFTESKEWIAGFAMLECADLDEAIEIASRNPMAFHGRLELRPVHSMGGPDD